MAMFLNILNRRESAELNREGGGRVARGERTDVSALEGSRGRRRGRPRRPGGGGGRPYRGRYQGFTVKHFHEHLVRDHGFGWGYTWLKLHLQCAGLAPKGAHRRKRERRPLPGMTLHQDGSRHACLEDQPPLDLIVTLDDATGRSIRRFWSTRRARPRPSGR
jgi:hypothetical protein